MKKVLFVCLGNICRSPMAEAIFQNKIKAEQMQEYLRVDSCGTSDYHIGELPDERTVEILQKYDIDTRHRGRQFEVRDFDRFDHILVMDDSNLSNVLGMARNEQDKNKVKKMRSFESDSELINQDVPDPYYGGKDGFENVYSILDRCVNNFFKELDSVSV